MGPLGRYCLRASLVATGVVLAVAIAAGCVRLLPWLVAPEVPLEVAGPFAKALGGTALETAVLVGIPVGFASGAALLVERGEARALLALGASPHALVASSVAPMTSLALAAWIACAAWNADAGTPGRFATQLIQHGKASCADARMPRSSRVPMIDVTWLCFPGHPPRVSGALPGVAREEAWFTASNLAPSDDLETLALDDLRIVTRRHGDAPALSLGVDHANVRGLPAWGRPGKLGSAARAALVVVSALASGLLGAWLTLRAGARSPLSALALGSITALATLTVLHAVDRSALGSAYYVLVPLVGAAAALLGGTGLSRVARRGGW